MNVEKIKYKLDIRFEDKENNLSVLVETININPNKKDIENHKKKLLHSYLSLEQKIRPNNNIILILAQIEQNGLIKVWKKKNNEELELTNDKVIKNIKDYIKYFQNKWVNNEIELKKNIYELNDILHKNDISEEIRGQFVGTCLLALKSNEKKPKNFSYKDIKTSQIISGITSILSDLLDKDINKATKLTFINSKILHNQKIKNLKDTNFINILNFIQDRIIPHINDNTSKGQDLLNLFFTTFNKYVGKKDKNQAFTPDHITYFMCKVAGVNKNSRVLEPTCGSDGFIVQVLIQELFECNTEEEKNNVKKNNIYGIEIEEKAYGLSTTNMLIHGDGNFNVILDDKQGCFGLKNWIQEKNIDIVLMNPPYNVTSNNIPEEIKNDWTKEQKEGKEDPTNGFCFVNYIADCVGHKSDSSPRQAKLLCLLPLSCALNNSKNKIILKEKKRY